MAIARLAETPTLSHMRIGAFYRERERAQEVIGILRLAGLSGSDGNLVNRLGSEKSQVRRVALKELDQLATVAEGIRQL
jgi:hypothetical protein